MSDHASILRELFASRPIVRIVGAHDGLGARLIERNGFDGIWSSGLEISTAHAVPDANILTMTEQLDAAQAIHEATTLPVVCDCDTGFGNASNVMHMVRKYEAAGLAAIVMEDKRFPKVNSFIPGRQELAPMEEFAGKIEAAKAAQRGSSFMVIARLEALIAGWGLEEALRRADAYEEAGADALVIHSKALTPDEIFAFAAQWKGSIPLVAIPTTYYQVTAQALAEAGFRMVIYANHGLRASIRAMEGCLKSIHETGSSAEIEPAIASMEEVFDIQGMMGMKENEERFLKGKRFQAIIPAAGDHRLLQPDLGDLLDDRPLCMVDVGGMTLIDRQMGVLRSAGVTDIMVIGGYQLEKIRAAGAAILENPDYAQSHTARSIMVAKDRIKGTCVVVYSDIVFDRQVLEGLLGSPHAVTLAIDRAYQTLPAREKQLDLVLAEDPAKGSTSRRMEPNMIKPIRRIGKQINPEEATHEFIGLAVLRERGFKELVRAWEDAQANAKGAFYESQSVDYANFTDLIQCLVDRGSPVHGLEIEHGWAEIHSKEDYERLNAFFRHAEPVASGASP